MKKFLFVIFAVLCMGSIVAQTFDRDALIEQHTQKTLLNNKKVDIKKAALVFAENAKIDTLVAEAALYYTLFDLMKPEIERLYAPLSDSDLSDFIAFKNSDICKKIESEKFFTEIGPFVALDMVAYMSAKAMGKPYKSEIPTISDKEYDKLADVFIENVGISSIMGDVMNLVNDKIKGKALNSEEQQLMNATKKYLGKTFPLYYKNALYSNITKDELKTAVALYSRPAISVVSKNSIKWVTSMTENIVGKIDNVINNEGIELAKAMSDENDTTGAREKYNEYFDYIKEVKKEKKAFVLPQNKIESKKDSLICLIYEKYMLANNRSEIIRIANKLQPVSILSSLVGINLSTEAATYYIVFNEIKNIYSSLSENELYKIVDFVSSDLYKKINSNRIKEAVTTQMKTDIYEYMKAKTKGKNYKTKAKAIEDTEYDNLANQYIDITNVLSHYGDLDDLFSMETLEKMEGLDETAILYMLPATNFAKNNLTLYYKNALLEYIPKKQLQAIIDFYTQPYIQNVNEKTKVIDIAKIKEQISMFVDYTSDIQDTIGVKMLCLDYLTKVQNSPIYTKDSDELFYDTLTLKNGGMYIGETSNGLPNGYGSLLSEDGTRYSGDFRAGKRHGLITTYSANGDSITEVWAGDKKLKTQNTSTKKIATRYKKLPMGYGYYYDGSCKREGFFIDGKLNGYGIKDNSITGNIIEQGIFVDDVLIKGKRIIYTDRKDNCSITTEGEFYGNIIKGKQTEISNDGKERTYQKGVIIDGKLEGYGVYEYTSNILEFHTKKSEGFFVADELYGTGNETITWSEKNVKQTYEGEFWYGEYHGIGNYEYSEDGYSENYKGTFSNRLKNGKGTLSQKWNSTKQNNTSTIISVKERIYIGEFNNDQYDGKGVLIKTFEEGYISYKQTSEGTFCNNKLDGEFVYTEIIERKQPQNRIFACTRFGLNFTDLNLKIFKINIQGNLKNERLDGYAKITTSAGEYYDGIFKDGEFWEGKTYIQGSSDALNATFKDGIICKGTIKYAKGVTPAIHAGVLHNFRSKLNGYAKITTSAGEYYDGIFKDGVFWEGKAHYFIINNNVLDDGIYKDGGIFSGTVRNKEGQKIRTFREGVSYVVRKKK